MSNLQFYAATSGWLGGWTVGDHTHWDQGTQALAESNQAEAMGHWARVAGTPWLEHTQ